LPLRAGSFKAQIGFQLRIRERFHPHCDRILPQSLILRPLALLLPVAGITVAAAATHAEVGGTPITTCNAIAVARASVAAAATATAATATAATVTAATAAAVTVVAAVAPKEMSFLHFATHAYISGIFPGRFRLSFCALTLNLLPVHWH
jgi:hypothetical protein